MMYMMTKILGEPNPDAEHLEEMMLGHYLSNQLRRQVLNTLLFVMKTFNYCSIANQLCILIMDGIKTQFDCVDFVSIQKFIINEFAERHQFLNNLIR